MKFTKIILLGLFLIILSNVVMGGISNVIDAGSKYKVTYSETVKKGWNLLPTSSGSAWDVADSPGSTKMSAIYLYLPIQNKYVSAKGGFNDNDFNAVKQNSEFLTTSASWYYFSEDATLSFTVDKAITAKLHQGWNLLTIPPSFTTLGDSSLKNFPIGNCEVEKLYMWNSESQTWENLAAGQSASKMIDELSDPDAIGLGVAIKVKNTCALGKKQVGVSPPPSLPG